MAKNTVYLLCNKNMLIKNKTKMESNQMMKKLILTLFIMLSAMPLWADWKGAVSSNSGDEYYIDFDRIREKGGYVYYWNLIDLKEKDDDYAFSYIEYNQGDCGDFRVKTLSRTAYAGKMGGGEPLFSYDNIWNWSYAIPNSVGEGLLEKACKHVGK